MPKKTVLFRRTECHKYVTDDMVTHKSKFLCSTPSAMTLVYIDIIVLCLKLSRRQKCSQIATAVSIFMH